MLLRMKVAPSKVTSEMLPPWPGWEPAGQTQGTRPEAPRAFRPQGTSTSLNFATSITRATAARHHQQRHFR